MNTHIKNIALAAIVTGAVLLSGCASTEPAPTDPKPQATEVAETPVETTPEPEPAADKPVTLEDIKALPAGTLLNDAQVKAMRGSWKDGVKAYKLESGETMLVQTREPLPEAVKKDAGVKLKAIDRPKTDSTYDFSKVIAAFTSAEGRTEAATGKQVCAIIQAFYANNGDTPGGSLQWIAAGCTDGQSLLPHYQSKASTIAAAEAFIAKQSDPSAWEIIVEP